MTRALRRGLWLWLPVLLLLVCGGCGRACGGPSGGAGAFVTSHGTEPVAVDMPRLAALSPADVATVERVLASHPRWDVREETIAGRTVRFAVRKERQGDAGPWGAGTNGFVSDFSAPNILQTRVIIGLNGEYGAGSMATAHAAPVTARVDVELQEERGQPGLSSLLVVRGPFTVEIFEQTRSRRCEFTERTLPEIEDTIAEALAGGPPADRGAAELRIEDGMQPGMFAVRARANPGEPGKAYMRVFFVGPDPAAPRKLPAELTGKAGLELSADRIGPASKRVIGHGAPGEVFPYEAGITVYEGDWEDQYLARFELWFLPDAGGGGRKLLDETRSIAGWMR